MVFCEPHRNSLWQKKFCYNLFQVKPYFAWTTSALPLHGESKCVGDSANVIRATVGQCLFFMDPPASVFVIAGKLCDINFLSNWRQLPPEVGPIIFKKSTLVATYK